MNRNQSKNHEQPKYKTVRIHANDYEKIRKIAFEERVGMIDIITEAMQLKEQERRRDKRD